MKVVTFGEIMLRLATPGYLRFNQTNSLTATFGGSEANVAVSLANFGIPSQHKIILSVHYSTQSASPGLPFYQI